MPDKYVHDKEAIIDGAMMFMSDAGSFWNLADIEVKKRVQDAVFPDGLEYDFDTGFRTVTLAESYQLMADISENRVENPSMVGAIGTNWNQVKRELITMWQIVKAIGEETTVAF